MQRCMQCGAESRDSARFCEQCGQMLSGDGRRSGASQAVAASAHGAQSTVDEVVETMAREPGVRKGWGFRVGVLFLLGIACAAFLWTWSDDHGNSRFAEEKAREPEQQRAEPARAPSLAEQMGQISAPSPPNNAVTNRERQEVVSVDPQKSTMPVNSDGNKQRTFEEKKQRAVRTDKEKAATNVAKSAPKPDAPPLAQPLSTAQEVARCEKMSVFARQPCLWRACNNKWGKDGCPAYD